MAPWAVEQFLAQPIVSQPRWWWYVSSMQIFGRNWDQDQVVGVILLPEEGSYCLKWREYHIKKFWFHELSDWFDDLTVEIFSIMLCTLHIRRILNSFNWLIKLTADIFRKCTTRLVFFLQNSLLSGMVKFKYVHPPN